jgi:YqjK-like protein
MTATRAHLIRLAERRTRLQERAHAEREGLASLLARSDEAAALLQRLRRIIDELRRQPWIVAGGMALLVALRPRRALGWLMKGWSAWRLYRGAQRWWNQFAGRNPDTGAA